MIRPWTVATVLVVVAFLVAGVFWPNAGDGLLRLLLATLAIGYIGVRGYRVIPPIIHDPYSPFGRDRSIATPPGAPHPLRELARALQDAAGRKGGESGGIPASVRAILRDQAARRLSEQHRLSLDDPRHHARIRSLVTEPTWHLIRPSLSQEPPLSRAAGREASVPLTRLDHILDDLERL